MLKKLLSVLLCGLLFETAYAEPKVVAAIWDKWVEPDGTGYGADIFHFAMQRMGSPAKLAYFPANRAINEFKLHHYDCYLGGDAKVVAQAHTQPIISSKPLFQTQYVLYTLKTKPRISSLTQIQDSALIGIVRGIDTSVFRQMGMKGKFDEAGSIATNVKKMKAGYIQMYLGTYPEMPNLIKDLHFDPSLMLKQDSDSMHCYVSEETQRFIQQFDMAIEQMRKEGTFRKIIENNQ